MPWIVRWVLISVVVPYVWKRREMILSLVKHMLGGKDEPTSTE